MILQPALSCTLLQGIVHDLVRHMRGSKPLAGSFSALLQATVHPMTGRPLDDASVSTESAALFFACAPACMPCC